jgi:hypothetical protein
VEKSFAVPQNVKYRVNITCSSTPGNTRKGNENICPSKEKNILTLVKIVGRTLFRTVVIGVKTITIDKRAQTQLLTLQRQLEMHSQ